MLQGQVVPEVQSTNLISTRCRYRCKGCQKGAIGFRSDHWWYVFGCLYSWSASFIVLLGFFMHFMRLKTLCLRAVNFHAIGLVWRQMPSSSPGILIDRHVSTKCRSIEYGFHMLSLAFHLFYLSGVLFHFTLSSRDSVWFVNLTKSYKVVPEPRNRWAKTKNCKKFRGFVRLLYVLAGCNFGLVPCTEGLTDDSSCFMIL